MWKEEEKGESASLSLARPYSLVDVPRVVTELCNCMATITSTILMQAQGNAEDSKTKIYNL
jgi:hypothetical protein